MADAGAGRRPGGDRRGVVPAVTHRRLSRYHAGDGASQHDCAVAGSERHRDANHVSAGTSDHRPAGLAGGPFDFQDRPVANHRRVRRGHRHSSCQAVGGRAHRQCRIAQYGRRRQADARPDRHRTGRGLPLSADQRSARPHRAAYDSPLDRQSPIANRARRGRGQHLGRIRKAIPRLVRPGAAGQVRAHAGRRGRGAQDQQRQRRRRKHLAPAKIN